MRKFFSLMAAILFAGSMMADSFAPKALADITADDVVIVTMQKDDNVYAMSNDNGTSNPPTAVAVTVADGKISTTATNILWTMAKDGDNLSFAAGENHLYCTNTNNGVRVGANTGTFIISDGYLCCTSTSSNRFLGVYNSQDWRCYTTINSNISGQTLVFYVREGEGGGDDPQPQPLADGFYLVGTMNAWTPAAAYKFEANPDNEAEMVLAGVTLAENAELKVRQVENGEATLWYPAEAGNYVVDAAHAGEKDIYFRADYAGDQNYWYAGCIYIAENVVPVADFTQPFTLKFNGTGSGSDASTAFAADVAAIFDEASAPYVAEVTDATKVYAGRAIADDNSSVKFGTTSAQGTLAFTLAQAIEVDSIVVNATQYGNNVSKITVNGTEFDLNAGNKVPQNVKITPAGEISAITIAQSSSERMYLRAVTVYPKQGGGDDPQPQPVLANGYYLVGNQYNWTPAAERMFAVNPGNEAEMMLTGVALAVDDSLKVVYVENDAIANWFPAEAGNYVVDADHAGEKDIYFRADYQGGEGWYAGCIYIAANEPDPQPGEGGVIYDWAGAIGTTFFGPAGVETSTVKIHTNTDQVDAIKFGSSYVYADGKYIAIKPAKGGFKAGDVLSVAVVFNNADATKYAQVDLRAADGDTRIWLSDSASTINGRTSAAEPIVQTYTLAADQDSLLLGRYGNTAMFITLLKVERGVEPQPQPLADGFYLVGTMNEWTPAAEYKFAVNPDNEAEMVLASVTLAENAELKVRQVENGEATAWFPAEAGNYVVDADHAGLKDIYFRADYAGAADWYAGCIYIAANSGTAIINTEAAKVAVKQLRNGMVIIRRGDREYSIMGQLVK